MSDRDTKAKEYDAVVAGLRDEPCAFKRQCFRDGWDAAIAALPDMVKPLEWANNTRHGKRVSASGDYVLIEYYPDGKVAYCIQYRGLPLGGTGEFRELEAAKAVAQAHYTAAFLSALGVQGGEA